MGNGGAALEGPNRSGLYGYPVAPLPGIPPRRSGRSDKGMKRGVVSRDFRARTVSTGSMLESLIQALHYVPDQARGIRSARDLPACLRDRTQMHGRGTWRAWGNETYIWFVTAERIPKSREPALLARFFDMDGLCMAKGIWKRSEASGWILQAPCA